MAAEDLLGAGLDIEGWSYLKGEVAQKISELTDRSLILRSTFPMVIKSKVKNSFYLAELLYIPLSHVVPLALFNPSCCLSNPVIFTWGAAKRCQGCR
jgi:hypothetical protein